MIQSISFKRHLFPREVICYAAWLYFRFTLSVRDVEELLAQRGIEVSRETVRCWVIKFGPLIGANPHVSCQHEALVAKPWPLAESRFNWEFGRSGAPADIGWGTWL